MTSHDPWTALALEIVQRRTERHDHRNELGRRLKRLVEAGKCPEAATGWVRKTNENRNSRIDLSKSAQKGLLKHPAVALKGLSALEDGALLSFIVTVRKDEILKYSVGLTGTVRGTGQGWFARFDLDESEAGSDPCAHAMLHCHIGQDPDSDMKVRVPVPWLAPGEALDWLLSMADATPPGISWSPFKEARNRKR